MKNNYDLKKVLTEDSSPRLPDSFVDDILININQTHKYKLILNHNGLVALGKKNLLVWLFGLLLVSMAISHQYQQRKIESELLKIDTLSTFTLQAL